jgi:hypothetical protein
LYKQEESYKILIREVVYLPLQENFKEGDFIMGRKIAAVIAAWVMVVNLCSVTANAGVARSLFTDVEMNWSATRSQAAFTRRQAPFRFAIHRSKKAPIFGGFHPKARTRSHTGIFRQL